MDAILGPPLDVRGLKRIEKDRFCVDHTLPALRIPLKHCNLFLRTLKKSLLCRPRVKSVHSYEEDDKYKIIFLDPGKATRIEDLEEEDREFIENHDAKFVMHNLRLTYDNFTSEQILRAVLPEGAQEIPSAFETVGHIAHLNLRDIYEPYKQLIGQVILDKNAHIKTVVNKTGMIDDTFRFFQMELLAGEDRMVATVKEHGCQFKFDYSKVYWNSRLQSEHRRIVSTLTPNDVVFDAFAGVGPFAIPAAKQGCTVYANDLNPDSYSALKNNASINKLGKLITCSNLDGRDFIRQHFTKSNFEGCHGKSDGVSHLIMNLPAIAVEFLDVFASLIQKEELIVDRPTLIHCYCFSKHEDPLADAKRRVETTLGCDLIDASAFMVRDVAPQKVMVCVTFWLSKEGTVCASERTGQRTSKHSACDGSNEGEPIAKQKKEN